MSRRLSLALGLLIGLVLLSEIGSFIFMWVAEGEPVSWAGWQTRRAAILSRGATAEGPPAVPRTSGEHVLHPYVGYVGDPTRDPSINEFGFEGPADPVQSRAPQRIVIGVVGGEAAVAFAREAPRLLEQALAGRPGLDDREIVVVDLARRGYKQPQQLFALSYVLSLGGEFDAVVNIDGSGELVDAGNAAKRVFPVFPRDWYLLTSLAPDDTVAIAVYAGAAGTVLEPTAVRDKQKIINAMSQLRAGGSTAGAQGIRLAYELAEAQFDPKAINRVILATDGDFNVGITNQRELQSFIERKREKGVFLSVLGFGQGNYQDQLMQALAQNGNGVAAYIDTLSEAQKVLVDEATSTLFPIAKDVKIQVEFNPATVAEYRLIGYET